MKEELLWLFLVTVLLTIIVTGLILIPLYMFESKKCAIQSSSFESHEYTLVGGCMVFKNGEWKPIQMVRDIE